MVLFWCFFFMVRKVQVTRLKEQIHKLHDERDDFQLREAKLTQENSRYDDTLRYVTLHFKFRHRVLEKWPKIALFVLRRQIYLNLQSWTKVLGQICICRTFWNYSCSIPLPTQQTTLDAGVYKEYFSSLNIVYCVRGRIFTDNCEYCITFPRTFVQDCFSWYCCKRKLSCS